MKLPLLVTLLIPVLFYFGYLQSRFGMLDFQRRALADAQALHDKQEEDLKALPELRQQLAAERRKARREFGTDPDPTGLTALRRLPAPGLQVSCEKDGSDHEPPLLKVRLNGPPDRVLAWLAAVEGSPRHFALHTVDLHGENRHLSGVVRILPLPLEAP